MELPFVVGAPLAKRNKGRNRKLRIKGCLEGGHKKKKVPMMLPRMIAPLPPILRGKMIRGPVTCKKCGEMGHRQASYKCPLNGTKKRQVFFFQSKLKLSHHAKKIVELQEDEAYKEQYKS